MLKHIYNLNLLFSYLANYCYWNICICHQKSYWSLKNVFLLDFFLQWFNKTCWTIKYNILIECTVRRLLIRKLFNLFKICSVFYSKKLTSFLLNSSKTSHKYSQRERLKGTPRRNNTIYQGWPDFLSHGPFSILF